MSDDLARQLIDAIYYVAHTIRVCTTVFYPLIVVTAIIHWWISGLLKVRMK